MAYLCSFLNSKLFKFCFKENFPELLGETRELRKVFFDIIPVKEVSDDINKQFEELIENYITSTSKNKNRDDIDTIINESIYKLYSIDDNEKDLIESQIN